MFQEKSAKKFILSENSIVFIKSFLIPEMQPVDRITEDILDDMLHLATMWESDLAQAETDVTLVFDKERALAAISFVSEISGQWDDKKCVPDFADLNARLGLA